MHFIRNKETEKVELHFSKEEYKALDAAKKTYVKSNFRFAPSIPAWVSKRKLDNFWDYKTLLSYNFEDQGTVGQALSFAEKVERDQDKAVNRAERMEKRVDKNEQISTERYEAARQIGSFIPPGQPILVGHHSEGRHRRDLAKIDNNMRKSVEASDKAAYYRDRLASAEATAEGAKFKNAGYLVNRIKECETNIRAYKRQLEGKTYTYSEPSPISDKSRQYLEEKIAHEEDKENYMRYCLLQIKQEKGLFDKENLKGMKFVKINGRWRELIRANPTTVSVANGSFSDPELQRKYPLKYNYGEVQDAAQEIPQ